MTEVDAPAQAVPSEGLSPAGNMLVARATHSATRLRDGRVLIAGGFRPDGTREVPIADAELYDPASDTFTTVEAMVEPRSGHTATLLASGEVLMVGGWSERGRTATAEVYDPDTGRFRPVGHLSVPRASMTATLLPDGQVVVIGGDVGRDAPQLTVEIYDPETGMFSARGELSAGRSAHTATLLVDGTILVAGGASVRGLVLTTAELYDPATGRTAPTGEMHSERYKHAAVTLPGGEVLLVGGSSRQDWTGQYTSTEIYDPQRRAFRQGPRLARSRFKLADAVVLLRDGAVLVAGGNRQLERLDPGWQQWRTNGRLEADYYYTVATLLEDGRVLITGGYDATIRPTRQAWLYAEG